MQCPLIERQRLAVMQWPTCRPYHRLRGRQGPLLMCTRLQLCRAAAGEVSHLLLEVAHLQGSLLQLAPERAALPVASHPLS